MQWTNNIMLKQSTVIGVLLLFICQMELYHAECPNNCDCFNNREATCQFVNTSVHMKWDQTLDYDQEDPDDLGSANLDINCEGINYICSGLPKLDIKPRRVTINITYCPPSIVSCINYIYQLSNNLENVYLYETKDFKKDDFEGVSKLRLLYLNYKNFTTTVPLQIFPNVSSVLVNGGRINIYPYIFNATRQEWNSLQIDNIESLPDDGFNGLSKLTTLRIGYNDVQYIPAAALRGLTALESFLISSSRLENIDPKVFSETKNLKTLYFGDGCLTTLRNELLQPLNYIESVTIYNNSKHIEFGDKLFSKRSLEYLEITKSGITTLPESLFDGSSLKYLYFTNNKLMELPLKIFWNVQPLKFIYFNGNQIKKIHKDTFSKSKYLAEIDFSDNNIDELSRDLFIHNPLLKLIKLNKNNIIVLDLVVFKELNLFKLDIPSNAIQTIVGGPSLSLNIRDLDLSDNNIKELGDFSQYFNKISSLNISGNKIETIVESKLQFSSSSITIDFKYNNVSSIIMDKNVKNNTKMYLANNNFECECNTIIVLQNLEKQNKLYDYKEITCGDIKQTAYKIKLSSICNKIEILIGLIGSGAVGLLILLLVMFTVITHRNKITKKLRNFFKNPDTVEMYQNKLDDMRTNDVFISFAHQDVNFVNEILLPKLENEFNQKVCVHYRDWLVGHLIPDQIIKSVEDSRITIIVLTEHFIESEWSYLEFRTAQNLSIQEGKPKLIVIIQNESVLNNEKLNDLLKNYVVDNGYLLFNDTEFWMKLKSKLPRKGKALKV